MTQTFITLLRRFTDSLMWRYSSDCQAVKRRISLSTIRSYKFLSQSIILQFLNFYIFHFTLSRNHYVMRPFSRPCAVFPYKFSPTHNFFFFHHHSLYMIVPFEMPTFVLLLNDLRTTHPSRATSHQILSLPISHSGHRHVHPFIILS